MTKHIVKAKADAQVAAATGTGTAVAATITREPINNIVPHEQDFLFIKSGGLWQKVRQKTYWNSARLLRLAGEYAAVPDKKLFVQTRIMGQVDRKGGRFLRGSLVPAHLGRRIVWTVVEDCSEVMDQLMRILRQMRQRTNSEARLVHGVAKEMARTIDVLDRHLGRIKVAARSLSKNNQGKHSFATARRAQQLIDAMIRNAENCRAKLGIDDCGSTISDLSCDEDNSFSEVEKVEYV